MPIIGSFGGNCMQTKNAIGNLINRYRAVLKKCNLLNTFGTLAIASAIALSGAGAASAATFSGDVVSEGNEITSGVTGESTEGSSYSTSATGGVYLKGEHTLDNATFIIKTDDHAGYGDRLGFDGASEINESGYNNLITVIGQNNITQMLTVATKTQLLQSEKNEKGSLNITGYLTISREAADSDLSQANINIISGPVGAEEEHTAGALILDNAITVGNLNFGKDTTLSLYKDVRDAETETNYDSGSYAQHNYKTNKKISIADNGSVVFGENTTIKQSGAIKEASVDLTFAGGENAKVIVAEGGDLNILRSVTLDNVAFENNGIVKIAGFNDTKNDLKTDLTLSNRASFTGGNLHVGADGQTIKTESTITVNSGSLFNVDSLTVAGADGKLTTLTVDNKHDTANDKTVGDGTNVYVGTLDVQNYGTVNISGVAPSNAMNVSLAAGELKIAANGQVNVSANGTLEITAEKYTLADGFIVDSATNGKISLASGARFKANDVNYQGNAFTTQGTLDFNTLTVSHKDQTLALSGGGEMRLESGLTADKGITINDFELRLNGENGGAVKGNVTLNNTSAILNVEEGTWTAGDVTVTDGQLSVNGGVFQVAKLDTAGSVVVDTGTLEITGTTAGSLQNGSGNITLDREGSTFIAGHDVLFAEGDASLASGVSQISAGAGTAVKLSGDKQYTISELAALKGKIISGEGHLGLVNSDNMIVGDDDKNTDAGLTDTIKEDVVNGSGLDLGSNAVGMTVSGGNNNNTKTEASTGGYTAKGIVIKNDSVDASGSTTEVTFGSGSTVLTGDNLVTVVNQDGDTVETILTAKVDTDSSLTLKDGNTSIDTVSFNAATSEFATVDGTYTVKTLGNNASKGKVTAGSNSTITADNAALKDVAVENGGKLIVNDTLELGADITIGTNEKNNYGSLSVGTLKAQGKILFADPAWKDGVAGHDVGYASQIAVEAFDGTAQTINAKLVAGQAGQIAVGTKDTDAIANAITQAGLTWGNGDNLISAAFGVFGNKGFIVDSTNGAVVVDGMKTTAGTPTAGNAEFAANSLFVVDANAAASGAALTATNVNADKGAHLLLLNTEIGKTYTVANGTTAINIAAGAWGKEDVNTLHFENGFLTGIYNDTTTSNTITIEVVQEKATDVMPELSAGLGSYIDKAVTAGEISINSSSAGSKFLANASNISNATEAAATIEGAARAAVVSGAPQVAVSIASQAADLSMARTSFAPRVAGAAAVAENGEYTNISAGDNMANGMNLWIMPMYQHNSADGFKTGNFTTGFDSDFGGVIVGGDYTWANSFRLGISLNAGTGSAESTGSFAKTENDFDSVGVGIYAGYMLGNLGLSADVNYTNVSNEVSQMNSVQNLSGDFDTNVTSVGVRAEYKIATEMMDIIPHIGARYSHISMDDLNLSGVLTAFSDNANIWQFPIGVTFAKDFATENGWNIKPALDLAVIPVAGDKDFAQDVAFTGVTGLASVESEIMDSVSGRAQLGVEVSKDQFYFGLDYAYQGSSDMDTHGVQANIGFKF